MDRFRRQYFRLRKIRVRSVGFARELDKMTMNRHSWCAMKAFILFTSQGHFLS